ncbi:hypothetical protein [Reyranella sp.]|uniref:hypothetical protein n=1 Tax=Reyranella sp. TaxID=1929291 RepID=UPI003BA97846
MDYVAVIIGIAVAAAVGVLFRRKARPASTSGRAGQFLAVALAAGVTAAATSLGIAYLRHGSGEPDAADVDRALEATRAMPLVGLVMAEHPEVEAKIRAAIEEDVREGSPDAPRANRAGVEMRQQYIIPTLRKADDASALAAIAAQEALMRHLQASDERLCRDVGLSGFRDPRRLDAEGQSLLRKSLASQETAYRNGKSAGTTPRTLTGSELPEALGRAGFGVEDLERLGRLDKIPYSQACAVTVKLYGAPAKLPPAEGAPLARWMLTIPQ